MKKTIAGLLVLSGFLTLHAQSNPFEISLHPIEVLGVGGVQSYASATHEGKWLIIGGRLDGLHRRQPWASFDQAGHNDQLLVVDPVGMQSWTSPMNALPESIQEQLRSTNMEFYQAGDILYVVGGYGYSAAVDDHITFPYLTAIDVPAVMEVIINDGDLSPHFRQIEDEDFAVTGGGLERIDETFYLAVGQQFNGRYNPMDMPTFTQEYTEAIRRFDLTDDGEEISVTWLEEWSDAAMLHRRDLNVVPQILPGGDEGFTLFSGVFQPDADIPFLDCVNITSDGPETQADFSQYYNHYHCATLQAYSASSDEMHTVFFGGIAQYYQENGLLVMDDEVPFVRTIARVTRQQDGTMAEYLLPIEMPEYLGSGAELILLETMPTYDNGVLQLDLLEGDSILIGHIYGGIESSDKNIFWVNDGSQSVASNVIFEVYLKPNGALALDDLNIQSQSTMRMQLYPNNQTGKLYVDLFLSDPVDVLIQIHDLYGRLLKKKSFRKSALLSGENELVISMSALRAGHGYVVTAISPRDSISQKMIINE
jgi:hypothetical protein